MFSCEFFEISKNTFFHRAPLVAASDNHQLTKIKTWLYYFLPLFLPIWVMCSISISCNLKEIPCNSKEILHKYFTKSLLHQSSLWRLFFKVSEFPLCNVNVVEKNWLQYKHENKNYKKGYLWNVYFSLSSKYEHFYKFKSLKTQGLISKNIETLL